MLKKLLGPLGVAIAFVLLGTAVAIALRIQSINNTLLSYSDPKSAVVKQQRKLTAGYLASLESAERLDAEDAVRRVLETLQAEHLVHQSTIDKVMAEPWPKVTFTAQAP